MLTVATTLFSSVQAIDRDLLFSSEPQVPKTEPTPEPQVFPFDCSTAKRLPPQTNPAPTWDINLVDLGVVSLGNDAYALVDKDDVANDNEEGIAAPTTGGFIVTPGGIVVIETYLNYHTACEARQLIQETAPGVPIKYVVCTSNHGDHCYGSSVFAAPGVKFAWHQNTYNRLKDKNHLAGDKSFMQNGFGWAAGIQETQPITENMEFLLASDRDMDLPIQGDTVIAKYFGEAQTPGDLFVWHPRSGALFTGNPVIAAKGPTMPWLLDGNVKGAQAALHRVRDFAAAQSTPPTVVPGHGAIASGMVETTAAYSNYFEELQTKAAAAVAAGMSLDAQGLAAGQMPAYEGYTLYNWVQNSINWPAAFVEAGGKILTNETCGSVCFPPQGHAIHDSTACDYCASGQCVDKGPDDFWVVGSCA